MQAARRRLEVVRTTNALQRATQGCHSLGDLPRLEAAILAARKTKDVDADVLRHGARYHILLERGWGAVPQCCRSGVCPIFQELKVEEEGMGGAVRGGIPLDCQLPKYRCGHLQRASSYW